MTDKIFQAFLERQFHEGMQLAAQSDIVDLTPYPNDDLLRLLRDAAISQAKAIAQLENQGPPDTYTAQFTCKSLVRQDDGQIMDRTGQFTVGIRFASDHLRRVEPLRVVTWLDPFNIFHPNIHPPGVCVGRIGPGTGLVDLLYQCYEMISFSNWAPHDPLNEAAAQWARNHGDRFPLDRRPLKRRSVKLQVVDKPKEV